MSFLRDPIPTMNRRSGSHASMSIMRPAPPIFTPIMSPFWMRRNQSLRISIENKGWSMKKSKDLKNSKKATWSPVKPRKMGKAKSRWRSRCPQSCLIPSFWTVLNCTIMILVRIKSPSASCYPQTTKQTQPWTQIRWMWRITQSRTKAWWTTTNTSPHHKIWSPK